MNISDLGVVAQQPKVDLAAPSNGRYLAAPWKMDPE
jgi:hypothetical protein